MTNNIASLFPELDKDIRSFQHDKGVLPSQEIEKLIKAGYISSKMAFSGNQIQPASMDLRLGPVAHRVRASFLPGENATVSSNIEELRMHEIDLSKSAVLEKGCVYIAPLLEELSLPKSISGKANPKSTTGRLDICTRLITDYCG